MAGAWIRHTIDGSSEGADGVRLADVNGDGLMDIATAWEEGGVVRVDLNPGADRAKAPWPAITVGHVGSPEDAVFADVDGDGAVDVVSSCEGTTRTVYLHWAPGDRNAYMDPRAWRTEAIPATAGRQSWMYALPMDVDGRNGVDLIVGSKKNGAGVGWLESPADPRDVDGWTYHRIEYAGWIMSLESADMDGDGDPDVVVSDRDGPRRGVYWLENPGPERNRLGAPWARHQVGAAKRHVMFLQVLKQATGRVRAILAAVQPRTIMIWTRPDDRDDFRLVETEYPAAPYGTAKAVCAADLDGDGRPELVISCEHADGVKSGVLEIPWPQPDGGITPEPGARGLDIGGAAGWKYDRLELLDLDGDGDLDIVTTEERDLNAVVWYENPSIARSGR